MVEVLIRVTVLDVSADELSTGAVRTVVEIGMRDVVVAR